MQCIVALSQLWYGEVQDRLELQNLHHNHVMIPSELKSLNEGKVVIVKCKVFGCKNSLITTVQVFKWYSPLQRFVLGSNYHLELF